MQKPVSFCWKTIWMWHTPHSSGLGGARFDTVEVVFKEARLFLRRCTCPSCKSFYWFSSDAFWLVPGTLQTHLQKFLCRHSGFLNQTGYFCQLRSQSLVCPKNLVNIKFSSNFSDLRGVCLRYFLRISVITENGKTKKFLCRRTVVPVVCSFFRTGENEKKHVTSLSCPLIVVRDREPNGTVFGYSVRFSYCCLVPDIIEKYEPLTNTGFQQCQMMKTWLKLRVKQKQWCWWN